MEHFFDTVETIPAGYGFAHFSPYHLGWLLAFAVFTALMSVLYCRSNQKHRKLIRCIWAVLLVSNELFKLCCLLIGGNYMHKYLPLHLCSINIFLIAFHAFKPLKFLDNFLYTLCIPGAAAALLFPTWATLPAANFMHLHSFTIHILLAAYPIVLLTAGEIKPQLRYLPKVFLLLAGFAAVALAANLLLDANFMFLMYPEAGTPLCWFEDNLGNHLIGYPVIGIAVVLVMYAPILWKNRKRQLSRVS